ncbi:MAG: zinc ribbon domain-containing protein [Coriobacteriales bacterium]|nr:zinc ribbon domain-containing protein [Coriobacteriales bacterium]
MFCPKCGAQIPDGSLFCGACGASIEPPGRRSVTLPTAPTERLKRAVPYLFCILAGLAFAACIYLVVRGFMYEMKALVVSLAFYEAKVIRDVVIAFAVILLIPCILCLFGFENCIEAVVRRNLPKKMARTVAGAIVAASLFALLIAAPEIADYVMPVQVGFDIAMAVGMMLSAAARISLTALWPPIVAAVLLIIAAHLAKKRAAREGGVR